MLTLKFRVLGQSLLRLWVRYYQRAKRQSTEVARYRNTVIFTLILIYCCNFSPRIASTYLSINPLLLVDHQTYNQSQTLSASFAPPSVSTMFVPPVIWVVRPSVTELSQTDRLHCNPACLVIITGEKMCGHWFTRVRTDENCDFWLVSLGDF